LSDVSLRIEFVAACEFDRAVCEIGRLSLERGPDGVFVEIAEALVARARIILGRHGVDARVAEPLRPASNAVPGSVRDLAPLHVAGLIDRIWVRTVGLGEASHLARRGILRRYDAERLRPLLRDEDRAYAWRRVVWMPRAAIRARELRAVRPIVFDRAALNEGREHWALTRSCSLARWIAA
jgi:hypothetical protein